MLCRSASQRRCTGIQAPPPQHTIQCAGVLLLARASMCDTLFCLHSSLQLCLYDSSITGKAICEMHPRTGVPDGARRQRLPQICRP